MSLTRAELLALPAVVNIKTASQAFDIGKTTGYDLARRGEFPVKVLQLGRTYKVPVEEILKALGIERDPPRVDPALRTDLEGAKWPGNP